MTASKLVLNAASGAGGAGLDVDEVFNIHLYTGSNSTQLINNGIDLTEGGMSWIKRRSGASDHSLFDSERGPGRYRLEPNTTAAQEDQGATTWNAQSSGFYLGGDGGTDTFNNSGSNYVAWTWRKAPKFFDVVTYTGNGSFSQAISHSLGVTPGLVMIKRTDNTGWNWVVAHRRPSGGEYESYLNSASASLGASGHSFSSTSIVVGGNWTADSQFPLNTNGYTYVVYLFAHNDGNGNFGPNGNEDIIKVGEYTGNGNTDGPEINLGFEPQWLMVKNVDGSGNWEMLDVMRGMSHGGSYDRRLRVNNTAGESDVDFAQPTPTGFKITNNANNMNTNSEVYMYMAIRRGPMSPPEDATKVFVANERGTGDTYAGNHWPIAFVPDMNINTRTTGTDTYLLSRLAPKKHLTISDSGSESNATGNQIFTGADASTQLNLNDGWWSTTNNVISWTWKRAPSYFDQVYYTGNGSNRTINHNLDAAPEMMWIKRRSASENWTVYHSGGGNTKYFTLDDDRQEGTSSSSGTNIWNDTSPTSSVFSLGTHDRVNTTAQTYAAFLFGTTAGISKVGSYTGTGADDHVIDCGFTSGARFVMIRITGTTGEWMVWDSVRGIVTGADPYLSLDTTGAEASSDILDPDNSGFIVNSNALVNSNGYTYIFYAIA